MSGIANMRGGIDSINRLKGKIRDLPLNLRTAVAKDASGWLDIAIRDDFKSGETVYDTPRPLGVNGQKLTLVDPRSAPKTSRKWRKSKGTYPHKGQHVRDSIGFTQNGTIIRAQLGQKYARYLVGKYQILPQLIPASWRAYLTQLVEDYQEIARERGLL